jgi:O-antigen/teichoic acid export membrane protein
MKPTVGDDIPHKITNRTARGATTLIASRLAARSIDLVSLAILGRLLSPGDFGLVAIATSIAQIVEAVMELPVGIVLVSFPTRTGAHFDTAFTLQLMRGVALTLILMICAWPISWIYHDNRLIGLICVLGVGPAFRGLSSPRIVEYTVNLDFWPTFLIDVAGKLVAFALSGALAWWTRSYWALAINWIAYPMTASGVSFLCAPYLPTISISKWRDFSSYLRWTTPAQLVTAVNWQLDQLVLGRFVNRFELGRFSTASNVSFIPWQIFIIQLVNPLLVSFSLIREDADRLVAAYRKSSITVMAIGLPVYVGMSAAAEPLVRIVLGDQWSEAAPLLRWLALSQIPSLFVAPLYPLAMTFNRTNIIFRLALTEFVFRFPLTLLGIFYYGIAGALLARIATATFVAGLSMLAIRELIQLPVWSQLLAPWRPTLSTIVMLFAVLPWTEAFGSIHNPVQLILDFMWVAGLGVLVYVVSIFLLWRIAGRPDGFESSVVGILASYSRKLL